MMRYLMVGLAIIGSVNAEEFRPQAAAFEDALQRLGVSAETSVSFERIDLPDGKSYQIYSNTDGVVVNAETPTGAAHAAATLLRLAEIKSGRVSWPDLNISDGPDYPYRSFMVDMGRNPHSPETLRQVVDMCWFFKVNYLQLHLTDDQLFSWPSKAFPKLYSKRAGWTWADFVKLETYSQARGVTIIPELEVPGHSIILRKQYPEIFGKTPTELSRAPSAREGIKKLIDEMCSVFKATPYFHIGGDEAYGVPEELQRDLINDLNRYVKSKGKRTVVWEGPRLGKGDNKVDEDVLHINWRTINFPADEMIEAGYEIVHAPWDPLYIVDHYPRTMFTAVDVKRCYEWDPKVFAHVNPGIPTFGKPVQLESDEGIFGFCMPWWEGREENLFSLCAPRLAAVAAAAWNRDGEQNFEGFMQRNEQVMARLHELTGIPRIGSPMADEPVQGNLAFGKPVTVSVGAEQPRFGPDRLTNAIKKYPDHFLGYPTKPVPLEIVIDLEQRTDVSRIVIYETAKGKSYEKYKVKVSNDGKRYEKVGASDKGTRGENNHVTHSFKSRKVRYVKIVTEGCEDFVFNSFSRLVEVEVFAEMENE